MTFDELFRNTFSSLRKTIDHDAIRGQVDFMLPSMPMVNACRADDLDFFHPLISSGDLTVSQMHHAAQRYHLGKSKSGLPIFWMIDELGTVLDGHIASDVWISSLLKKREPLLQYWKVSHCLFGLHLLKDMPVSIVDSERSAVILSELCPESVWMAYASPGAAPGPYRHHLSAYRPLDEQSSLLSRLCESGSSGLSLNSTHRR